MKNAVIYARYSSYNQTEMSIEGQVAECKSYAEKNGLFIVHEYIDRAQSATLTGVLSSCIWSLTANGATLK